MESPISDRRWRSSGGGLARGVGLLLGLWLALARVAVAADASPPAKEDPAVRAAAKARLVEGVALLRQEQYAAALRKFDEAYALVPSPNVQYNRGLAFRGLGQNAAAIEAFEYFIASAAQPPAGTREQAQRHRDELRPRVARVVVTSELPGAELLVDGRARGFATAGRIVYLDPGSHELLARGRDAGSPSARAQVSASAGQELAVTLRLAPAAVAAAAPPRAPAPAPALASGSAQERDRAADAPPVSAAPSSRNDAEASSRSWWAAAPRWTLIAAGAGVVLLGTGVTFELLARGEGNDLTNGSRTANATGKTAQYHQSTEDHGLMYQTLGEISLAVGAAALVAGIGGYLMAGEPTRERGRAARKPARGLASLVGQPLLEPKLTGARLEVSF